MFPQALPKVTKAQNEELHWNTKGCDAHLIQISKALSLGGTLKKCSPLNAVLFHNRIGLPKILLKEVGISTKLITKTCAPKSRMQKTERICLSLL